MIIMVIIIMVIIIIIIKEMGLAGESGEARPLGTNF